MKKKIKMLNFVFVACLMCSVVVAAAEVIENETVRIRTEQRDGGITLVFQTRALGGEWRTVLSNVAESKYRPYESTMSTSIEDIEIAPSGHTTGPFFTQAFVQDGGRTLVRRGSLDAHQIEERITLIGDGHVYISVRDKYSGTPVIIARLMNHYYFVPDGRAMGYALPMDFAWLPGLHWHSNHVAGDRFFRSPAAVASSHGLYAAIIPDLDIIGKHRSMPHALDLRSWEHPGAGQTHGLPRLSYGLCSWEQDRHVYTAKSKPMQGVRSEDLVYGFDMLLGTFVSSEDIIKDVTSLLWDKYGHKYFQDIRPQVMPFEEYRRKYSYVNELFCWATKTEIDGKECYGINNHFRRGANFHAWENDLHVGFGVWYYGDKWGNEELRRIAKGIMQLSLSAPVKEGAFPCIYNFKNQAWEGSFYSTSQTAWPYDGYDAQAMGVSAWWRLLWYENFKKLANRPEISKSVLKYTEFLTRSQLPSGAIPTYYDAELRPAPQLKQSATTAIGGAVLAKAAMLTNDDKLKAAAIAAGQFLANEILPTMKFYDFEVFYSCTPRPLFWVDAVNGIPPVNTLALQWSCDQFLALHRLTGEKHWLDKGEYCLSLLSMFHQVWPSRYESYLYGGFGVQTTDGEWNAGHQARFVLTYADYYNATGNIEYLERAVAACRASFAAMDMKENHANNINQYSITLGEEERPLEPGKGYAPECLVHGAPRSHKGTGAGWTGFNWGPGGALGASAYLELHFGSVWVDGKAKKAIPIDGATAAIKDWKGNNISLKVGSALTSLPYPYAEPRRLVVKFGRIPRGKYTVKINKKVFRNVSSEELKKGLSIDLPKD